MCRNIPGNIICYIKVKFLVIFNCSFKLYFWHYVSVSFHSLVTVPIPWIYFYILCLLLYVSYVFFTFCPSNFTPSSAQNKPSGAEKTTKMLHEQNGSSFHSHLVVLVDVCMYVCPVIYQHMAI